MAPTRLAVALIASFLYGLTSGPSPAPSAQVKTTASTGAKPSHHSRQARSTRRVSKSVSPEAAWLASTGARCIKRAESGDQAHPSGDYSRGGDEPYGGAWQASVTTWHWMGFSGVPNQASAATQDRFAYELFERVGFSWWQTASGCGV